MLKKDFIKLVLDDITVSGSIPISLSEAEIERLINKELPWLYQEWNQAFQETWTIMDPAAFQSKEFKAARAIQLPPCVLGIKEFREINDGGRLFGINDPLLGIDRLAAADYWLMPWSSGDTLVYRTIQYSYWDLLRGFSLRDISFQFNPNTHKIIVTGRTPNSPVLIKAYTKIPEENMYDDPLVQRWIIAKAKINVARVIGTFTANLIGGISINSDMWKSEGEAEIQELKDKIKSDNVCNWFLTTN